MRFNKGDSFTKEGRNYKVLDKLGEGGQGVVYLISDGANNYAFKLYISEQSKDFIYNLKNNIHKGAPSNDFIWPKTLVEFSDGTSGYIMDLRPKNYSSFISYLTGKTKFSSYRALLDWCIRLVNSFKKLHERGYAYQDLNDGSFFLEPNSGDLLICDNDNVSANKTNLGILGKMRYMAPEIVRGDIDKLTNERQLPDMHSDRFSLAVILFMTLCMGNPFEGECLKKYTIVDEQAEYEMYGANPVYVYNENDNSNRPIRGYHTVVIKKYKALPSYIKDAFHKTFTDGLKDRENGRTTELEWIKLLCKFRDELISCDCGKEYIYGFNEKNKNITCPYCKKPTRRFCVLQINKNRILLEPNKKIYKVHLDKYSDEYTTPIGRVIQNPKKPSIWGIKLDLENDIEIKDSQGNVKSVDKKGVITIINNLLIKFNDNTIGKIVIGEL